MIGDWFGCSDFSITAAKDVVTEMTGRCRLSSIVIVGAGSALDTSLINDWTGCLQALVDICDVAAFILLKSGNLTNLMSFKG